MGVVYRAEDVRLGRDVAIKFLPDSAAANPQALERFHREAHAASALNHRHICTIHEIDEHEGRPFIVMEMLEGETLRKRIERKRFDLDGLLDVTMQVAEGLDAAHNKGIVHRDIKPSNIYPTEMRSRSVEPPCHSCSSIASSTELTMIRCALLSIDRSRTAVERCWRAWVCLSLS